MSHAVRVYNGEKECPKCGWGIPQPGLSDAVLGFFECAECEYPMKLNNVDRREILDGFDQRLHVLEFPLG